MKMNSSFPVLQSGKKIYVDAMCLDNEWARKLHGQSIYELAGRGGLSPKEIVLNIERRPLSDVNFVSDLYANKVAKRIQINENT